ncbi:MAG TPA: hypothetical protein VHL53_19150 [Acidimicrobiia bacterium]|nr:hypothetical protein [Acidimicrobiia bacterium]
MTGARRRRLIQAGVAALLVAPTPLLLAARGGAADELGNYNGTVSATAVHVQGGSSAFPNFNTGAIDNHYPLALAKMDSSPNAEAYSSPLDTGPLGQTAAGAGNQTQPQYADVRCPAQCDDKPVTAGSQPGPFSSSQAGDHHALAVGQAGGAAAGGGSGGQSVVPEFDAARTAALRSALSVWRAQFLTADDALRYPMPAAGTPDGFSGDSARSESKLDGSTLVLDGQSAVGHVSLGGGALVLDGVSVKVTLTNDGTPKKTVSINVGSALVGGTPVTIGADGVAVNGQAVPGIGQAGAQASAALNQALGQAGIEVRSLAPSLQQNDHQLTLDAVGVLVRLAPASPAPGVPAQFTAMAIGEVFADSLAVPGEPGGELDDGLPGDVGGVAPVGDATVTTSPSGAPEASSAYGEPAGGAPGSEPGSAGGGLGGFPESSGSGSSAYGGSGSGTFGSSGSAPGSSGATGSALGSGGSSGGTNTLVSPAASRRLVGHDKPTELLLLYLLWQSLVIGTAASLYLWRKAAA